MPRWYFFELIFLKKNILVNDEKGACFLSRYNDIADCAECTIKYTYGKIVA